MAQFMTQIFCIVEQVHIFDCGGEFFLTCTSPVTHFILPPYSTLNSSPNQIKAQTVSHFIIQRIPSKDTAHPFRHGIAEVGGKKKEEGEGMPARVYNIDARHLLNFIFSGSSHAPLVSATDINSNEVFKRYFVKAEVT